jgi:rhodanese-related sulfurtransferase
LTRRAILTVALLTAGAGGAPAQTDDHYCGVYSVYICLRAIGVEADPIALCDRRYIGSHAGSTQQMLLDAIRDRGATGAYLTGMSVETLRQSPYPMILHVRHLGHKAEFDHWLAFLGVSDDGRARFVSPPEPLQHMTLEELAAIWDGSGIIVSNGGWAGFVWVTFLSVSATLLLIALAAATLAGRLCERAGAPWLVVPVVATATGIAIRFGVPDCSPWSEPARQLVAMRHHQFTPALVDLPNLKQAIGDPRFIIVDCRFPDAYREGNIPGSVNFPVSSGLNAYREFVSKLPSNAIVCVYCQSERCEWCDFVANALMHLGAADVRVYRGGWAEWSRSESKRP